MTRHTIKLLWLFAVLSCVAGYQAALARVPMPGAVAYLYGVFFAAGLLAWLHLTLRIFTFGRDLARFARRVISNEYETGVKVSRLFDDEVSVLSRRINKMAEQLAAYDGLQRERISVVSRALDVVCHSVKDNIIIFDIKQNEFRFNPPAQEAFAVEQESFGYNAVAMRANNAEFIGLLRAAVEKGSFATNASVDLELPVRQTRRKLVVNITPVKDKHETVELCLIFFKSAGA